ncbi:MAG: hypothetical protein U0228_26150 [Myxococcaceae bacterium]
MALPPCGLYRTMAVVAGIPAGRLVYFHNHGDPGPGLYLPSGWSLNRAQWNPRGHTLPDEASATQLAPLPAEGLYVVKSAFFCCEKRCREFNPRQLVQLGYDGEATPILFVPELSARGLGFPERGQKLDGSQLERLERLLVASAAEAPVSAPGGLMH